MDTKLKELFSNTILFTIANFSSKVLVFLMVPLYTYILAPEDYGIANLVQTTSNLLYPILSITIAESVLRFCFIDKYVKAIVFSYGVRVILFGSFVSVILGLIFRQISIFEEIGLYVYFIPVQFMLNATLRLLHSFARGIDKVRVSATAGVINTFLIIAFNLFFLLVLKIGVMGYMLSYACADTIVAFYLIYKTDAMHFVTLKRDGELFKSMIGYCLPLMPNSISWWALDSFNQYLILSAIGLHFVGMYSAALKIPTILTVFADIFAQAWLLSAIKDYGSEESKMFIKNVYKSYSSILVVVTSLIILFTYPLAKILLSGQFFEAWRFIPYLFISVFWGAFVGFYGSIFSAERKNIMQLVSTLVGATISVVIALIFVKEFNLYAIAIANMIGYFIIWLVRRISVNKYIDLGISTFRSIFYGAILIVEAWLVSSGYHYYAIFIFIILTALNMKQLLYIIIYFRNQLIRK